MTKKLARYKLKFRPKNAKYCYQTKYSFHSKTYLIKVYNKNMKVVLTKRMKASNVHNSIKALSPLDLRLLKRRVKKHKTLYGFTFSN